MATVSNGEIAELKQQITLGKFQNVDMRVARVVSAGFAEGTNAPCRVIDLDLGTLGKRTSVGQYVLVDEADLVGRNVVVCINLGSREMGAHMSDALLLGTPHPDSPEDQAQALPLYANDAATPGQAIY